MGPQWGGGGANDFHAAVSLNPSDRHHHFQTTNSGVSKSLLEEHQVRC